MVLCVYKLKNEQVVNQMATKIEKLNQEIRALKLRNKSLTESCQSMEKEIASLKEQQNIASGINQDTYIQLQRENEKLKSENFILKHRVERLEQDIKESYAGEKTHNERGAGRKCKLSSAQVAEIQSQRQQGVSYRKLAEKYGCSAGTIYNVCSEIK